MQIVPLDPVMHFDLHAAILGWLLTATQPKLQHMRHRSVSLSTYSSGCRVDVSPTNVSPTKNSWMLRPLNKASLGYCVPDRCAPTLDRVQHETSSVGCYHGLSWPPAGRLASFAYAPGQVYWIGAPWSNACSAHT
jgi:hypothetical protein